ncbi:MAG TPA: hypothetical protein VJ866_23830 [Pyrinomonadaceae bacterium]|nr:hypothetical protein [Pyrinomonadaceae bacterium]
MKLLIQERFRGDVHYAWCSESFDSSALSRYSLSSQVAPSSNPADIYRELKLAVQKKDQHSYKINEQKLSLKKLAVDWEAAGEITSDDKEEIIYRVDNAAFDDWRPLIYIVPRAAVQSRIQAVPPIKRASFGPEYIIADLRRSEFDVIEL